MDPLSDLATLRRLAVNRKTRGLESPVDRVHRDIFPGVDVLHHWSPGHHRPDPGRAGSLGSGAEARSTGRVLSEPHCGNLVSAVDRLVFMTSSYVEKR